MVILKLVKTLLHVPPLLLTWIQRHCWMLNPNLHACTMYCNCKYLQMCTPICKFSKVRILLSAIWQSQALPLMTNYSSYQPNCKMTGRGHQWCANCPKQK